MVTPLRVPLDVEFLFIQTVGTGTVHVTFLSPPRWDDGPGVIPRTPQEKARFIRDLMTFRTRCGRRVIPDAGTRHRGVSCFPDELLCAACYHTLHPQDRHLLFTHDQPGDRAPTVTFTS